MFVRISFNIMYNTENSNFEKEKLYFQNYILNLYNKLNEIIISDCIKKYRKIDRILNDLNGLIVYFAFQSNFKI